MTDEQIVKGLESCTSETGCHDCPYDDVGVLCDRNLIKDALFLIRRQIGEIEDLKQDVSNLEETNGYLFAEFERRYGDESRIDEHTTQVV